MARFTPEARASLAFLIGYLFIFGGMLYAYLTNRYKWRSWWSLLFFHVTVRLVSQACGIAFGILGLSSKGVFLAYLNLATEGYFTLILCIHRFLKNWHEHNLPCHKSWLDLDADHLKKIQRFSHIIFNVANICLIVGGSLLSGADFNNVNSPDTVRKLNIAKITRTLGNSIFLASLVGLLIAILATMVQDSSKRKRVHPTLIILLAAWVPTFVRGVFAVFQAALWSLSYYNPKNHTSEGFSAGFTALENLLGVLTEWIACVLLNMIYFTSKGDPPIPSNSTSPLGNRPVHTEFQHLSNYSS